MFADVAGIVVVVLETFVEAKKNELGSLLKIYILGGGIVIIMSDLASLAARLGDIDTKIANLNKWIGRNEGEISDIITMISSLPATADGNWVQDRYCRQVDLGITNGKYRRELQLVEEARVPVARALDNAMQASRFWGMSVAELQETQREKEIEHTVYNPESGPVQDTPMRCDPSSMMFFQIRRDLDEIKLVMSYKQRVGVPASGPVPPAARVVMLPVNIVDLKMKISEQERVLQGVQGIDARKTLETDIYALQTQLEAALERHLADWEAFVKRTEGNFAFLNERISKLLDIPVIKSELGAVREQVLIKFAQQQRDQKRTGINMAIEELVRSIESLEAQMRNPVNPGSTSSMERDMADKRARLANLRRETI